VFFRAFLLALVSRRQRVQTLLVLFAELVQVDVQRHHLLRLVGQRLQHVLFRPPYHELPRQDDLQLLRTKLNVNLEMSVIQRPVTCVTDIDTHLQVGLSGSVPPEIRVPPVAVALAVVEKVPEEPVVDQGQLREELAGPGEGRRAAQEDDSSGFFRQFCGRFGAFSFEILQGVRLVDDHHPELLFQEFVDVPRHHVVAHDQNTTVSDVIFS
jgi:hypothetical protein